MDIGVKTIGTHPLKSSKRDKGLRDVPGECGSSLPFFCLPDFALNPINAVTFAGVTFTPGHWVYADGDGVLVAPEKLEL